MVESLTPQDLRDRLASVASLLVLTGAGVSVASGLPVYRGAAGSRYDDPETLRYAFASTLHKDPAGFWARFGPRRAALMAARPNAAHEALARLEARVLRFLLATQNVDDLHARAGSRRVCELHGSARRERCLDPGCAEPAWTWDPAGDPADAPPRCPRCGGFARPDVVLFGEGADERWSPVRDFVAGGVAVVLLVGTSGVVEVPTELLRLAAARGRPWVVEVNPRPSDDAELASLIDARVVAPAEVALPALA